MASVAITGLDGTPQAVPAADLDELRERLGGGLLYPDHEGYAAAVRLWNGMITKRPAVVLQPRDTEEVVAAVGFARDHGLELSIKGGGHNIAGLALSDGGVTLDMAAMNAVRVDPASRTAHVGPGCTLGDVDRSTQEHGLAATLGFVSATGVAGLTLGGGFGYLTRRFGWTVDDLREVELVTADGSVRRVSRTAEPELFWALRGGGGNFGVATEFVFDLHEVGPQITGGLIAWPASEAEAVLDLYRSVTQSAPREMTTVVLRRNAPPAPWLPASAHGTPIVVILVCHSGDPSQAGADIAPIRAHGEPLADLIQARPYVGQQSLLDATQPAGMHYYWKSEFVPEVSDGLLTAYHAQFEGLEAPANQMVLFQVGGALNEHPEDDGAMGNRDAGYACVIQSMWAPEAPSAEANRAWVRGAWEAIRPFSTGGNYVNFQTADEADERTQASYRGNYRRLAAVKAAVDPHNLFRVNRNVRP